MDFFEIFGILAFSIIGIILFAISVKNVFITLNESEIFQDDEASCPDWADPELWERSKL